MSDYEPRIKSQAMPRREGEAVKADTGKAPLSLVPREALEMCAEALEFGRIKYGRNNYKQGMDHTRILDAALRHITAYAAKEDLDKESGLNHISHALACLAMLAYYLKNNVGRDDR